MQKKLLKVILFVIMFLPIVGVNAASYEFRCNYKSSNKNEVYEILYKTNGDNTTMIDCKYYEMDSSGLFYEFEKSCSNYQFKANGNYSKNSNSCPSSINVSKKNITWIAGGKGTYIYIEGSKTDLKKLAASSCEDYKREKTCNNAVEGCRWADKTCMTLSEYDDLGRTIDKVSCGSGEGRVTGIPSKIPELTSLAITIIQIAVPIILVVLGSIDLFKGITAGKEDEIKKGQQIFIKRLVVGAIIFLVVIIVKFLISVIADTNKTNIGNCIDCFISNDCEEE
ncbi:MAG: hypothetical protein IJE04_03505 [Bacilli bacterium]|nr:hypothetical protein [Bacilli bacterium]